MPESSGASGEWKGAGWPARRKRSRWRRSSVEGPIANVRGVGPEQVEYAGSAERLREVWIAVRANLRAVLEQVTVADLAHGELPASVEALASDPDAWRPH